MVLADYAYTYKSLLLAVLQRSFSTYHLVDACQYFSEIDFDDYGILASRLFAAGRQMGFQWITKQQNVQSKDIWLAFM